MKHFVLTICFFTFVFAQQQSNVSNSTQRFFVAPNVFQLRNLGEARYLGAEGGLRIAISRSAQFSTNYTYLSRHNKTMPEIIMLDTPRHKSYSMLTYRWHTTSPRSPI